MNKKLLICGSVIAVVVLVLASFSPVVGYKTLESEDELDCLLDEIKNKFDTAETKEEAIKILNYALVELNKYGLISDSSIKIIQFLSTNTNNETGIPIIGKLTGIVTLIPFMSLLRYRLLTIARIYVVKYDGFPPHFPVRFGFNSDIFFGLQHGWYNPPHSWEYYPAEGWITASLPNGTETWNGTLWGSIDFKEEVYETGLEEYHRVRHCRGISGFKGVRLAYFGNTILLGYVENISLVNSFPF